MLNVAKNLIPKKKKEESVSNCEFIISGSKDFVLECLDRIIKK